MLACHLSPSGRRPVRSGWSSRVRATPVALRLPLLHAALTFVCLSLLPTQPLSIPTALGIATSLLIYLYIAAYYSGYRLHL